MADLAARAAVQIQINLLLNKELIVPVFTGVQGDLML